MSTYLLKWNPRKWAWTTLARDIEAVHNRGFFDTAWTCGKTKRIRRGDRVFLLRTGTDPKGILASGYVRGAPYDDAHYETDRRDERALYVEVRFDVLLHPDDGILEVGRLAGGELAGYFARTQYTPASGITIPDHAAAELEAAWSGFLAIRGQPPVRISEEITTPGRFFEGAVRQISVNSYERNAFARQRCIEHYGCRCTVCGFDFERAFGEIGRGFIHVHHLRSLAEIGEEYEIDPIADLRPVCPNCHAMLHRGEEVMAIEELQACMRGARS